ncbi:hypothetical protein BDB00DRAFT_766656 [Zychaea mexicana]|uniref:uncharacterized protein n=1 Tax=Zychaea mexicana TaxID=64656 RepID=UPI0022FF3AEF|nr:uncharacterized protein BDB00DRAFT_766656 [Zychaea mexicana]KAI9491735.1 hypothetical protein BDB00DRAFT_766656 [Zychaea mexicana]
MQKQLRLNNYQDDESIRPQVDRLQQATGTAAAAAALEESHTRPPAPPKPRGGAVDAFEASLAPRRRQATPVTNNPTPTTPVSPPPPPVATKPVDFATKPVSPSATATPALNGRPAQQPPPIPSKPPSSSSPSSRSHPPPIPVKKPSPPLPPPSLKADDNDRVSVANPLYTGVRCAGCNKPIAGRVIRVDQNQWHVDCFKCKHCKQDLEHIAFHSKDGQPYCALDYHELFSTRCDYCGTPIEEKSISALGKTYHVGHFFCRECGKPFDESSAFMVHEGHPYCEKDYLAKFGHKCMGCGEYITGEFLGALGGDWHKECFVCADCGKAFESATFYVRNNKPFCEEHYKNPRSGNVKICQQCGDVIDGRAASAFGKDYHPHHFQCARCSKILSSRVPGMWMEGAPGELICKMCGRR